MTSMRTTLTAATFPPPSLSAAATSEEVTVTHDASGSMWDQISGTRTVRIARGALADLAGGRGDDANIDPVAYGHRRQGDCSDVETPGALGPGGELIMTRSGKWLHAANTIGAALLALALSTPAQAEIDGHGPDSWRVNGVASNDVLNARMGPGTDYPVIETFAHDERGLQQITCVPFYTAAHHAAMTAAQIKALPSRWCLMRDRGMARAGWVAQRFITPDDQPAAPAAAAVPPPAAHAPANATSDADDMVAQARDLVEALYESHDLTQQSGDVDGPLDPANAGRYFTDDIVAFLASDRVQAHPLYGAQDFEGTIGSPGPDPDQPMLRGMITINVDFTNFGRKQRAVYFLRADTTKPDAPLRIFRVEHEGWSYP